MASTMLLAEMSPLIHQKMSDPNKNLRKAETIRRAALAPATPSGKDHAVAAQASQMATIARIDIARLNQEERSEQAEAASESPRTADGAAQYQRLERETNPNAFQLNEYA